MEHTDKSRRRCLQMLATGAGVAAVSVAGLSQESSDKLQGKPKPKPVMDLLPGHDRRMQWWREARFGMFIHWGLYSVPARGEWLMAVEDIPVAEYEQLAKEFKPRPDSIRQWARLARQAGMKYMVMTTKHHDGFCLFDTKLTDFCAPKQAAGRDLVREYVDALRAEGLRVGFYFSLMDWHHPDGMTCKTDPAARRRFVEFVHGQVRELMTNYGKIDILWYDMAYPLDATGFQSAALNEMVLKLQPEIVVNNRSGIAGDFKTPEQNTNATAGDWESCMTLNDNWGYSRTDDNWKSPKNVILNLIRCAQDGGNYLLDIGPKPDGSLPEENYRILGAVGDWMQKNGSSIYGSQRIWIKYASNTLFTRKGTTVYAHVYGWPGKTLTIGGLSQKPRSAKLLATGQPVETSVRGSQLTFSGLPGKAPDEPVTVIEVQFDSVPVQDSLASRIVYAVLGNGPESETTA